MNNLVKNALEFYADPFAWKKKHDSEDALRIPDFYSETSFGDTAMEALASMPDAERKPAPEIYYEIWRRRISQRLRGYTEAHDDEHTDGSIADAAACYASPNAPIRLWPWRSSAPDHSDRRRRLVDAAALCIAEIERLDRASRVPSQVPTKED